jgi:FAD synthase
MFTFVLITCVILLIFWLKYPKKVDEGDWEHETMVVKGNGKFREIDWRTANLETPPPHVKQPGLYACMSNYGRATLFKHTNGFAEVHIHNFNKDIYDETIKLKHFEKHDFPIEIIDRT